MKLVAARQRALSLALVCVAVSLGLRPSQAAAAGSQVEFHYLFDEDPGALTISVVSPTGLVTPIEPKALAGGMRFVYVDDDQFTSYHKDLVFRFSWTQLPPSHSATLRNPIDFQLPVRLRNGHRQTRIVTFSLYTRFHYEVARQLDQLTSVDLGKKFANAALGARFFGPGGGKIATNWARLWFDAALELATTDKDDWFQLGEDARTNFLNRLPKAHRDGLWGRVKEAHARFVAVDGPEIERRLAANDCEGARSIYDQMAKKNQEDARLLRVARPNEAEGYYLGEKRRQIKRACGDS